MKKAIAALLLILSCSGFRQSVPMGALPVPQAGCAAPTLTYDWPAWGASNTCGGSACSNGNGIDTVVDTVAGNNLTQASAPVRPIYTTAAINALAAATFTPNQDWVVTTPIPAATSQWMMYAVVKPSGAGNYPITGASSSGAFEWRINANNQQLVNQGVALIGAGSYSIPTNAYTGLVATYNQSTGAWAMYHSSTGSLTADGSGTTSTTFTQAMSFIGFNGTDGGFSGGIAEVGFLAGGSTAGVATYLNCKYGI